MKKVLIFLLVAFAVFYLIKQPTAAADAVKATANALGAVFESITRFLTALFS